MSTTFENTPAPGVSFFTPYQEIPAGTAIFPQPGGKSIPKLFEPIKIRGVEFQNRIFLSSMAQYSAKDGLVTPWHRAHLGGIISRGPGLAFTEGHAVSPEGRTTPEDAGIWSDAHAAAWKPIVEFSHSQNQKIGIQIVHSGRKASTVPPWANAPPLAGPEIGGWPDNAWGPSTVPFSPDLPTPHELSVEGIKRIVRDFANAAKRSIEVGFDVIEIHAAHGFLLSSFLSPLSNHRQDNYGGSFENRIRLTLEVVDAIRAVIPAETPLFLRISGTEWLETVAPGEPSWRVEDTVRIAPILAEHGVDLLDVSAGGMDIRQKIVHGPEYQVPFAAAVKKAVGDKLLVGTVGGLGDGVVANGVVESGRADVVFVGRQFQKNPGLVWAMADQLGVDIRSAKQMEWGFRGRGKAGLGTATALKAEASKL